MYIKGDIDSNQKIVGNGLVLNVDAAQYRSLPRGGDIVTSELVLNLDAGNPSSYPGTGTTWYDISGNGQSATLTNFTYNSTNGGVLVANGSTSSGIGGFISTSIINTNKLTSEVWVYFTSTGGAYQRFLTTSNQASEISIIRLNSGVITFYVFTSSGLQTLTASSVSANTWYHIVGTWDGTTMRVYVNGSLAASGVRSGTLINATISPVYIISSSGESLNGYIPIARYYNRDLSAAEVTQNYDALKFRYGLISGPPGTISPINTTDLFIHLDANNTSSYPGSGTRFYDLSGNGNYFDLQNGSYFDNSAVKSVFLDGADDYAISNQGVQAGSGNYTFSVWFKNDNYSENKFILTRGRDGVQYGWSLYIVALSDGRAQIGCAVWFPATAGFSTPSTTVMALNTWYYITGVFTDGVGIKVYVNGVYENQASTNGYYGLRPNWSPDGWYLGTVNTSNFTSGYVAAVDVYRRALSDAEILNNFNAVKSRYGYTNPPTWYDISGYGNNGTLTNGPTLNLNNGGSIVFDGTNDYVNCGNNSALNITETFTISLWIYATSNTAQAYILDKNHNGYAIIIGYQSGFVNFFNGAYQPNATTTQISISPNAWTNIVYSKNLNSLSNNWSGYKNGVNVFTTTANFTLTTNTGQLNIGTALPGVANAYFNGRIANSQIYNRSLSATEVLNNFDAVKSRFGFTTTNIVTNGLILNIDASNTSSYPGSGANWFDISGYGNNGVLYNGPAFNSSNGGNISFDGADDYMDFGSYNFGNDFTICMWIKTPSSLKSNSNALLSNTAGGATQNGFRTFFNTFNTTNGSIYLETGNGSGGTGLSSINASVTVTVNGWNFITYTLSKTSSVGQIYKNGSFATSGAILNDFNTNGAFWFGRIFYSGYYVQANMANMRIYNRVLSGAEILQNYDADRLKFGL